MAPDESDEKNEYEDALINSLQQDRELRPSTLEKADELDSFTSTPKIDGADFSPNLIISLTRWQPFLHLFLKYANTQYPHKENLRSRVDLAAIRHPRLFRWCRYGDYILLSFLLTFLLIITSLGSILTVWKIFLS